MNRSEVRAACALALTLLSGCGGTIGADTGAALASAARDPAPVADCEADGCNQPRIVDGLAEQYRARAVEQAVEPVEPASTTTAAPAAAG